MIITDPFPHLPYYVLTYFPYKFVPTVILIRIRYATHERIYLGFICGHYYVHTRTFCRNKRALASMRDHIIRRTVRAHAHTIFHACRTICARAHMIFHARGAHVRTYEIFCVRASTGILSCTSTCLCVHAQASMRIFECAPASIRSHGGCSSCLSVVMSNILDLIRSSQ